MAKDAVALVFTDIEGSSRLWDEHGDALMACVAEHNRILAEACAEFDRKVVKEEGDAFFLVFPSASEAVAFALDSQDRLAACDWYEHGPAGFRVRMGLHYGEAIQRRGDYFGPDVNRAARVCSAGHGGQVLVSGPLLENYPDAAGDAVVRDLGRHRLRGMAEPEHLYQMSRETWTQQEWPPLRTLDEVPTNLPAQVTSFVGRESDLATLGELFADGSDRIITLAGPGGTGKSRLALQAAGQALQHFPDGAFWVELATLTEAHDVPGAVADALGLVVGEDEEPLELVAHHCRDREMLLVLDNMEQVIEAAGFVADLVRRAPRLRTMVTSREVLRVPGERTHEVSPLALPVPPANWETLSQYESVRLFLDRAQAASPSFAITPENAPALAELCVRLDGIPLALELAAAWSRALTPEQMLKQLGPQSRVLSSRIRGVTERQRTLQDAIEWSYRLLGEEDQDALCRLSVFRTGFFLDAAEAACGPMALDSVMNLREKSLLGSREALGQQRYSMLGTIREFAAERLRERGAEEEAEAAHRRHFVAVAERLAKVWQCSRPTEVWQEVAVEGDNLLQAFANAVRRRATKGLSALASAVLHARATSREWASPALVALLPEAWELARQHRGEAWTATVAVLLVETQRHGEAVAGAEDLVAMCDDAGDSEAAVHCISDLARTAYHRGRWDVVCRWAEELEKRMDDAVEAGRGAPILAQFYALQGEHDRAIALAESRVEAAGGRDLRSDYHVALVNLSEICVLVGRYEQAHRAAVQALDSPDDVIDSVPMFALWAHIQGMVAASLADRPEEAQALGRRAVDMIVQWAPAQRAHHLAWWAGECIRAGLPDLVLDVVEGDVGDWPPEGISDSLAATAGSAMAEALAWAGRGEEAISFALAALRPAVDGTETAEPGQASVPMLMAARVLLANGKPGPAAHLAAFARRLAADVPVYADRARALLMEIGQHTSEEEMAAAEGLAETLTLAEAKRLACDALES